MLQQAIWLAKKEVRQSWVAILFTAVVTVLLALFTTQLLEQSVRKLFAMEPFFYNSFMIDIMFIGITPSLAAIFMSGPYLSYRTINEDPYVKRMAFFRSLPIPIKTLALSRTFIMLATLISMSSVFYMIIAFGLSDTFFQNITPNEFLVFIFFWFGYTLALGGFNPFIEYGTSGKVLHITPFVLIGVLIIIMVIFRYLSNYSFVEWSLLLVKDFGWVIALISLLVGIIGCFSWNQLLTNRLLKRDFL
ncbi:hypothetical protein [Desulforamulus aquiferis]|uniref:ABC transporter permease n=1 Tax=Desulforamulus aquiferis TaxID=1397668 RepID=A0AAW7Z7S5_9FIRM|nr:hypothetical protein [Desulforamulus aquiferis]MDO7785914.1 hypothetical protein [Desulforamulus aquiferis]